MDAARLIAVRELRETMRDPNLVLPLGIDRFSDWLRDNAGTLGRRYESELRRNFPGQE